MAAETPRKKRTNVSDYLIIKKDGTHVVVKDRKKLGRLLN